MITLYLVAIFFLLFDRWLKFQALGLPEGKKIALAGKTLAFSLSKNPNIAFSLPISGQWLSLAILSVLALILVIILKSFRQKREISFYLALIFLGGLGNLIDRLAYGYVIDYFDLAFFSVFNISDALVTLGVLAILFTNFKEIFLRPAKSSS